MQIDAAPPAEGDEEPCRSLLSAAPETVADQPRRETEPEDAWGAAWGDPAIVLTCGGPAPEQFGRTSACTTVNGVDWFIPEEQLQASEPVDLTMTTVNREQYVRVELPRAHWPPATTLADLSGVVREHIGRTGSCR